MGEYAVSSAVYALSAQQAGEVIGRSLFLVLGVALVVVGLRRRRASGQQHVAPVKKRGTGLVVTGSALLLLTLASAATSAASRVQRSVNLPSSVLGLQQNVALSAQASVALLQNRSDLLKDAKVAAYGTPPQGVVVLATPHGDSSPDRALKGLKGGFERSSGTALGDGTRVDPGRLGGSARCWSTRLQNVPAVVCAFVDGGSAVTVYDFVETDPAAAGGRARTIREASVS